MSPKERRRQGNTFRDGGKRHPKRGNTPKGQRGSGHLVVPQCPGHEGPDHKLGQIWAQTSRSRGVGESALKLHLLGRHPRKYAEVRTGLGRSTVRDRREASRNVVMGVGLRPTAKVVDKPPNP